MTPPRTSHPGIDRRAARPTGATRRRLTAPRPRTVVVAALWTVIVLCATAYATSLAVPLWFQAHGQRLLIVTSGSMAGSQEGGFDAGDAVVMRRITDASELRVGQVASFWPAGSDRLVTHRIVALRSMPLLRQDHSTGRMVPTVDPLTSEVIQRPYIITKGDANAEADPDATPVSQVRGVVLSVYPRWGWVLDWARSPLGRLLMLGPPLAALATLELMTVLRGRRNQPEPQPTERLVDDLLLD
ncbi:signal peptidase I [Cellulomonas hominis]